MDELHLDQRMQVGNAVLCFCHYSPLDRRHPQGYDRYDNTVLIYLLDAAACL